MVKRSIRDSASVGSSGTCVAALNRKTHHLEALVKEYFSMLFLIVSLVIFTPRRARAGCVDYLDSGTFFCSAEGGCEGSYPSITCILGCISGTCRNDASGGLCCGQSFDVAQIYPSDGGCVGPFAPECDGPFTRKRRKQSILAQHKIKANSLSSAYRLPGMVFIPSRCEQSFALVFEGYVPPSTNQGN